MTKAKALWLLAVRFCLALWPAHVSAQGGGWEALNAAGLEAYQRGDYAEAEKQWGAALKAAEEFGSKDPRLATSLNNLAGLYHAQGRDADAEPLYERALEIMEKTLGSAHPNMAILLENMADFYKQIGRMDDAKRLEERAKGIRSRK